MSATFNVIKAEEPGWELDYQRHGDRDQLYCLPKATADWLEAALTFLKGCGYEMEYAPFRQAVAEYVQGYSNCAAGFTATMQIGAMPKTGYEDEDEPAKIEIEVDYYHPYRKHSMLETGGSPWKLEWSWNYPLQARMDVLLGSWGDIDAKAFDGEDYSGVLLGGRKEMRLTQTNLYWAAQTATKRVRLLWQFLDKKLTLV